MTNYFILSGVSSCYKTSILKRLHDRISRLVTISSDSHSIHQLRSSGVVGKGWEGLPDRMKLKAYILSNAPRIDNGTVVVERGIFDQLIFFNLGHVRQWYDVNPDESIVEWVSTHGHKVISTANVQDYYHLVIDLRWKDPIEAYTKSPQFDGTYRSDLYINWEQYEYVRDFFNEEYRRLVSPDKLRFITSEESYPSVEMCVKDLTDKVMKEINYPITLAPEFNLD